MYNISVFFYIQGKIKVIECIFMTACNHGFNFASEELGFCHRDFLQNF
jgi:hypothetical protein